MTGQLLDRRLRAVARAWLAGRRATAPRLPAVEGPGVVLAGSCADRLDRTAARLERERPVHWIDVERAIDGVDVIGEALDWALAALRGPVAIATSAHAPVIERVQARIGRHEAAALAEDILGRLAVAALRRRAGVKRFVISGGETSGSVLEHLAIDRLQVGLYRPAAARAVTLGAAPLALCLKSGKLGPIDMLLPCCRAWRRGRADGPSYILRITAPTRARNPTMTTTQSPHTLAEDALRQA